MDNLFFRKGRTEWQRKSAESQPQNRRNGFGGQTTIAGAVTASGTDAVDASV